MSQLLLTVRLDRKQPWVRKTEGAVLVGACSFSEMMKYSPGKLVSVLDSCV